MTSSSTGAPQTDTRTESPEEITTEAQTETAQTGEDSAPDLPPPLRADSTLQTAVTAYHTFMERKGFSANTMKAFDNDLKIFVSFMDGETRLHRITTQHLEEFLQWLQHGRGKPCSPKTLARRITTLKSFFGWIHGIGVLGTDPAEPVIQQTARPPLPTILRDDEVDRLMRVAQDLLWDRNKSDARPYLLLNLLLQTGMKKSEVAKLLVSDMDVSQPNSPAVTIRYEDVNQSHKNRRLSLAPNIVPALQQYVDQYKPQNLLFDCTPRNLEYVLDDLGEQASIKHVQVGFEMLRWTAAVRDYRMSMPEDQLRDKMGLSKISWRETREKIFRLAGNH